MIEIQYTRHALTRGFSGLSLHTHTELRRWSHSQTSPVSYCCSHTAHDSRTTHDHGRCALAHAQYALPNCLAGGPEALQTAHFARARDWRYAEERDLGPRRAISGDLALSRAISGPRRAISGDLGASLARRHTCSKKEGPGWSHGAHEDVLARFSPPRSAPLGPVRRRPARRVPRPVTPTPARTAHLQPSRGYSCAHAGEPGGTPFPPPPTG